jgi:hypothetical protein
MFVKGKTHTHTHTQKLGEKEPSCRGVVKKLTFSVVSPKAHAVGTYKGYQGWPEPAPKW